MKRTIIILLVISLLCSMSLPVAATTEEKIIQPRWSYFSTVTASLDVNWLGVATYSGSAQVRGAYTVKTVVYLQQNKDGNWVTLDTLSSTSVTTAGIQGKYVVERGYTYRATVVAYVYDDNGIILESASSTDTFIF